MAEVFPPSWFAPELTDYVVDFIANLPVDAKVKKRTLFEWSRMARVELTAEMVERVTGLSAGEV